MTSQNIIIPFIDSNPYRALDVKNFSYSNIVTALHDHLFHAQKFFNSIPDEKLHYAYAEGKWSVADILGHLIDHQLLFMHRAISFARKDPKPIAASDENLWAAQSTINKKSFEVIINLYEKSAALFLTHLTLLDSTHLQYKGIANSIELTVEQVVVYMIRHEQHHFDFIRSHYL